MTTSSEPPAGEPEPETPVGGAPRREPTDREVDDTFAALVAGLEPGPAAAPTPAPAPTPPPEVARRARAEPDPDDEPFGTDEEDEGHFERPDAPPVTPPTRAATGAIAFLVLGVLLVVAPGLIGLTSAVGFPMGLVCISGGLAFLLSRLRSGPPSDSGWDDGAQL